MSAPATLDGTAPLWLDDPACAWRLTAGSAQVFAVERVDGRPEGQRFPLFTVTAGELLMAPPRGAALALVAAGLDEDTTAVPVGGASGAPGADAATAPPAARASWLTALVLALRAPAAEQALLLERAEHDPDALELVLFERLAARFAQADERVARHLAERAEQQRDARAGAYTGLGTLLGATRERALAGVGAAGGDDPLLAAAELVVAALGQPALATLPAHPGEQSDRERVEAFAHANGMRAGDARLTGSWWREDCGPLLGRLRDDGRPVALLPRRPGAYELVDPHAGSATTRVDDAVAATLAVEATTFYRPLPPGRLTARDVLRHTFSGAVRGDVARLCAYGVAAGALSLSAPLATELIFSEIVPGRERSGLVWITLLLAVFAVAATAFAVAQRLALLRLDARVTGGLQSALWDRLLGLPADFFRRFPPGDLTLRVMGIDEIGKAATTAVSTAVVAIPVGVANLVLAFLLAPQLALFASLAIVATVVAVVVLVRYQTVRERRHQAAQREVFQTALELVNAIDKLRVANATDRAFVRWAAQFGVVKRTFFEAQVGFVRLTSLLAAATAFATALMFAGAATIGPGGLSSATFLAFNAAFLQALAAATGLSAVGTFLAVAVPFYDNAAPILQTQRETSSAGGESLRLRGGIEISHVSMRYGPDEPLVLRDVSLKVAPGEMVAIVGPSGSGKSSLMRVLLGFETPEVGTVHFDGHDLASLDARALRRQMGVVMQSSGLLTGDILMNIVGARDLTVEDAWDAARVAGVEQYVRGLPMGMRTVVGEGSGSFSGGQRQRLLIARAVAGRPALLLFDEATSALDNQTQAEVSDAISRLQATRIVIAHRLSTVRGADRIVVVEDGAIVQSGGFDELIAVDGPFRQLASRQLL